MRIWQFRFIVAFAEYRSRELSSLCGKEKTPALSERAYIENASNLAFCFPTLFRELMLMIMKKNPYPGKFIAFEGLDGSGQTTQANLLTEFFRSRGREVVQTKEPTQDSEAGKRIRRILDKKIRCTPAELQKLFAQDRKEHLDRVIIPALSGGKIVISDRYCFSSFAYGVAEGVDLDYLMVLNAEFLLPDVTFLLRVSPKVCMERIHVRGKTPTLFEKQEKLRQVWGVYEQLAKSFENVFIIDGEQAKGIVAKDIRKMIEKLW